MPVTRAHAPSRVVFGALAEHVHPLEWPLCLQRVQGGGLSVVSCQLSVGLCLRVKIFRVFGVFAVSTLNSPFPCRAETKCRRVSPSAVFPESVGKCSILAL